MACAATRRWNDARRTDCARSPGCVAGPCHSPPSAVARRRMPEDRQSSEETMPRDEVEILVVEDDSNDLELTLYALDSERISNRIQVVRDGEQALDFLF